MSWGGGPRGERGGLRRLLPFKRVAGRCLRYLERGGAWESLCLLLAERRMGGAGGRALWLFPFAFGKRSGLRARLGGAAPAPGSRSPAGGRREAGGGRGQAGGRRGARGARTAQRWDFSAREESGAGARPRRGSADSGAAGAGGGGEAAGTQEAGESRSRPASMGRLAPRPLLLALLGLGECARGSAGRGGRGRLGGAQLRRAAWGAEVPGGSRERRRGPRAARAGGERRGAARRWARIRPGRPARPRLAPPVRGGVARGRLPPALPTCWPPGARLTLNSGPRKVPAVPRRVPSRGGWKYAPLMCPAIAETGRMVPGTCQPTLGCLSREGRQSANFLLRRSRGGPERYRKNRCARPSSCWRWLDILPQSFSLALLEAA